VDQTFSLETPEQIEFQYELAGIGSRFIAALIDTFCLIVLYAAFFLAVIFMFYLFPEMEESVVGNVALALLVLVSFILFWGYYVIFELVWNGQSPGKRLTGLRVIQTTGYPETPAASVIRNLVRIADFLPAWYAVGVTVMFFNQRAMRLGDFAAGTMVVKERPAQVLDQLVTQVASPPSAELFSPALPNLERLTPAELAVIREAVRRRDDRGAAQALGRLAEQMAGRLDLGVAERRIPAARLLAMIAAQAEGQAKGLGGRVEGAIGEGE
jgi:uncharacterized RDD family membrane protein YckC